MNHIPFIKTVMTPFPFWISVDAPIVHAKQMMQERSIRHLPVKESGHLIGVLSDRDIHMAMSSGRKGSGHENELLVADVCVRNPYIVDLNEPLDNVLLAMARTGIGSAIVIKENRLAGMFTSNDACRIFGEYLREKFRPTGGDDAA